MFALVRSLVTTLVLAFALLAAASSAQAFDTGPHGDMTESAMRDEGFGLNAATIGRADNWFMDMYGTSGSNPYSGHAPLLNEILGGALGSREHWSKQLTDSSYHSHFDSTIPNAGITQGSSDEWDRIRSQVYWTAKQVVQPSQDPLSVLTLIGMSLHTVQDFYAHTNFSEPKGIGMFSAPGWDTLGAGLTPTWWDLPRDLRNQQDVFTGTTPGHRVHGYFRDSASKAMAKDWPGAKTVNPNVYTNTYMASYFASRQWIEAIRLWLNDDALWAKAKVYAAYASSARRDARGGYYMSTYAGHWQGEGEPWSPDNAGHRGYGGSLIGARQAANGYFEDAPKSRVRKRFEQLLPFMWSIRFGTVTDAQAPVPSSQAIQQNTRFVRYQLLRYKSSDLTDPAWDDADDYSRTKIAGQDFIGPILQAHDSFSFGSPYYPPTFIKPIPRGASFGVPVREIQVRVKTADVRWAGTDDSIYLRINSGERFELDKRLYDDFERGDDDTYSLPIDDAARAGLTVGNIRYLQIEKSKDGVAGGYKLGSVSVKVNGVQVASATANKWLENSKRSFLIPGFVPTSPFSSALPVWMDMKEDDILYGADDQGDVNSYDARNAVVRGYVPGTTEERTIKGGSTLGGRLNWGGDKIQITYRIETFDTSLPPPPPPPAMPPDLTFTDFGPTGFTVKNTGPGAAGPFNVQIVTGTPQTFNYPFSGLAPGASATQSTGFPCVSLTGTVDSAGQVNESNETNNGATYLPSIC